MKSDEAFPTAPTPFAPQQNGVPSAAMPHATALSGRNSPPMLTAEKVTPGGAAIGWGVVRMLPWSTPQQYAAPLLSTPQDEFSAMLTALKATPGAFTSVGTGLFVLVPLPSSPDRFQPPQYAEPPDVTPHAWARPEEPAAVHQREESQRRLGHPAWELRWTVLHHDRHGRREHGAARAEVIRCPTDERAGARTGREHGRQDGNARGLRQRSYRDDELDAAPGSADGRLDHERLAARPRDEHGPLLDAKLHRQRSTVDEREEFAGVDVLRLLLTRHHLDVCVSQLRACHERADSVHVSRRQRAWPRDALVGLPVHDVELVGGVDAHHRRAGASGQGELGDDRAAVRAGQLAHGHAGSLSRVEAAGRVWARDDGRQEIEVRVAVVVGPVADLEAWCGGSHSGGGVRPLGAADEEEAHSCGGDHRDQALHIGSLMTGSTWFVTQLI